MFLYDVVPPEMIIVGLNAENKSGILDELTEHFCRINKSSSKNEILSAIREREAKMSTGILKGVAIPHALTNAVKEMHGIIGISKKGISYGSLDGEPVYLVFMILSPRECSEKYLGLLTRLATLLQKPSFYEELRVLDSSDEAYKLIKQYEENLSIL